MQVVIRNQVVVDFCEKYPSFSIEDVVAEYVTSVNRLGLKEGPDMFKEMAYTNRRMLVAIDELKHGSEETARKMLAESGALIKSSTLDVISLVTESSRMIRNGFDDNESLNSRILASVNTETGDAVRKLTTAFDSTASELAKVVQDSVVKAVSSSYTLDELCERLSRLLACTPNDPTLRYLKDAFGNSDAKCIESSLRNVPNDLTLDYLKEVLSILQKEMDIKSTVKSVPNDITLDYLQRVMECLKGSLSHRDVDELGRSLNVKISDCGTKVDKVESMLEDYLNSFKTSSVKGRNAEVKTLWSLETAFPKHDVCSVPSSQQKGKMDIVLSHPDYPDISIDTKCYTRSVPKNEIVKFEGDIVLGNTHGIMISLSSKIIGKPHFSVDVIHGNVAVYLSNTGGDIECVKLAVDVIYSLSKILKKGTARSLDEKSLRAIEGIVRDDVVILNRMRDNLLSVVEDIKRMSVSKIVSFIQSA